MGATNLLDTKTVTLNEVLGNGKKLQVPLFQRDYSWDEDNWEDLWNDILSSEQTGSVHYMGSVVLQNIDGKNYYIIDGQQRFATLSILILALINKIRILADNDVDKEANRERVEILMNQYIGQKDPTSLRYSSKLSLNENNDAFYQQRLVAFKEPVNRMKLSDSEKLLWNAYLFFSKVIDEQFKQDLSGERIAYFLNEIVGERLMFIQIVVENELNAYTVFETLNSRGLELTSTDLLKNYLFSLVAKSETDLRQVRSQWKKIIDIVGLKAFPIFLRQYLNTRMNLISKEYLFKAVKQMVQDGEQVFALLDELEKNAYVYIALFTPDDVLWENDKEIREDIRALTLFRVTQCNSLLMIAYDKLSVADFKKVLRAIVSLSFRYNVIAKLQTNDMEKVYNRASVRIFKSEDITVRQILEDIRPIYLNDEDFKRYFEHKVMNTNNSATRKLVRYILYKVEAALPNGLHADFEIDTGTIEHILPEAYTEDWSADFSEEEAENYRYRLGNLTLLESKKNNREAAAKSFEEKKEIYANSQYALSRKIEASEWTPKMIHHRQARIASVASGIWKIQY
ncbi:DUF262 domain-containing HNH endonuclease family protein [Bacteroides ndongoniae]|uniref:DUF262 domain-containing protein n=1 Tax=Bacteroides ndongoniae TaxID=1903262 RepID=UPI0023F891E3|nr:DUF262 domain-containing HNH endonuclease family protein [Bacteroides ndongoniae]